MEHNLLPPPPPATADPSLVGHTHQPEPPSVQTTSWTQHLFIPAAPSAPPEVPTSLPLPPSLPHPTDVDAAEAAKFNDFRLLSRRLSTDSTVFAAAASKVRQPCSANLPRPLPPSGPCSSARIATSLGTPISPVSAGAPVKTRAASAAARPTTASTTASTAAARRKASPLLHPNLGKRLRTRLQAMQALLSPTLRHPTPTLRLRHDPPHLFSIKIK